METKRAVTIMGHVWSIEWPKQTEDPNLEHGDGYCDWTARKIVVAGDIDGDLDNMAEYIKKVLRHEIVHAFLEECGLSECSGAVDAWARNEAMVDWFAKKGPEIYAAWREADAL